MEMTTYPVSAPDAARLRAQVSMWTESLKGIRVPFSAVRLHSIAGLSDVTYTANAAQGATKDARGDEAFEDPV